MKKFSTILILTLAFALCFKVEAKKKPKTVQLATTVAQRDIAADVLKSASNYYAYPFNAGNLPALTPAPAGYTPFYIDHYGRHGSRWLIDSMQYVIPIQQLTIAERNGKLTPRGKEVLAQMWEVLKGVRKRFGDLTDVGAEQHRGIAERMYRNFPEVFAGDAEIDAKSTIVIRCILSMENECQQLISMNPKLRITHDASHVDMYYMNFSDKKADSLRRSNWQPAEDFRKNHVHPEYFLSKLITDSKFAGDSIDSYHMITNMFDVTGNMQSHHSSINFYDLFSPEEIYDLWQCNNAYWYTIGGASPITKEYMPYIERNLLANMLQSADKAIANGKNCATLRFGHESCLLPLTCLMDLNGMGKVVNSLDSLANQWQNYKVFPMACNIQMVFYHNPSNSDVILKVLLNEHEAALPVASDIKPYYHWKDVKAYYENKLAAFKN
jgi:hypothetical protein